MFGDQHHLGGHAVRRVGDHAPRRGEGPRLVARAVVEGGLQGAHGRIPGRERESARDAQSSSLEVLRRQRQLRQLAVTFEAVAVLINQQGIIAEGGRGLALGAQEACEGEPGGRVLWIEPQDVAELDRGALGVAFRRRGGARR